MTARRSKRQACLLCGLLGLTPVSARAAAALGEGTSAATLLTLPVGARTAGMGGAFAAVSDDVSAIHGNPAGLALLKRQQAGTTYLNGLLDMRTEFLGYAFPLPESVSEKPFALGASLLVSQLGRIEVLRTNPDGSFLDERTLSAGSDLLLSAAFAAQLKESVLPLPSESQEHYFGVSARYLNSTLAEQYSARAFATDIGYMTRSQTNGVRGALVVSNLGTKMKFKREGDPLPLTYRLGLAWRKTPTSALTAAADFLHDRERRSSLRAGIEYCFKALALRAGYQFGKQSRRWTSGFGVQAPVGDSRMSLDYALVPLGALGLTHSLSLSLSFGPARD